MEVRNHRSRAVWFEKQSILYDSHTTNSTNIPRIQRLFILIQDIVINIQILLDTRYNTYNTNIIQYKMQYNAGIIQYKMRYIKKISQYKMQYNTKISQYKPVKNTHLQHTDPHTTLMFRGGSCGRVGAQTRPRRIFSFIQK